MASQPWMCIGFLTSMLVLMGAVEALPMANKIVSLPGQPRVSFQQFAGYIDVDDHPQRSLFYYFVEAESRPASKPLVVWFNGGPGCSSVGEGAFVEHGPFKPSGGATLIKNPYSWNTEANMLYLESPAGVGFSFAADKSFYENVNDDITARDSLTFLQRWFDKFPEYNHRDLFLVGESYAGHYVPQLAQLIIHSRVNFNLKGIAIGNPLLEFSTDINAEDLFYWSHGLISDAAYGLLTSVCNSSQLLRETIAGSPSAACSDVITQVSQELSNSVDKYYVTGDICLSPPFPTKLELLNPLRSNFRTSAFHRSRAEAGNYNQQLTDKIDACVEEETVTYLNRKDVQKALHAKLVGVSNWSLCSRVLQYDMGDLEIPTIPIVGSLVKSGIRVMVYSGDQDSVVPFFGSRSLINGLAKQLGLKSTVPYRAWFEGKQVGGWTQVYGDILSFAIIRGASHTAPSTQPKRSLALFKSFLGGKPLPAQA
ncbi:serine carboxypeptidase-like 45 [Prunus avium]|uniref:Carboxypeptidase n=1 Tax=Prunus avium TaxID=42229 RepID=A0A6P5T8K0_PRUAV|nr:serine carboxypeptidase-like 45 [Prunus avium]